MKRFFIVIFILIGVNAQAKFDWNQNCQKAYTEIINLRFTNGKEFLEIEKQKNPRNLLPYFIENYIDFLTIQIGEEERDFNRLKEKRKELETIIASTEKEEKRLLKKSDEAEKIVDERLLTSYKRIRGAARNGLAVVSVERDACGGCFSKIPPQRQLDIKAHKKVIICEHCGRILIDANIFSEEEN